MEEAAQMKTAGARADVNEHSFSEADTPLYVDNIVVQLALRQKGPRLST